VSRFPNKYVIGLTGNIGVGKSVVRQMAQHLGAYPIDADGLSQQVMQPGAPAYQPIVQTFGQFILDGEQRINRALLGQIVFSNPTALAKLEAITHPFIRQAIGVLVSRAKQPVIIIEAIKLLEGELAQMVDEVWVVDAKPETQYKRLIEKRKMSPDDAKQRMLAQAPQSEKLKKATLVINNDGNVEETWKQVQTAWNTITAKIAPPAPPAAPAAPTPAAQQASSAAQTSPTIPVRPEAAKPAPATPAPAAAPAAPVEADDGYITSTGPNIDTTGTNVRRGMPGNAEIIANFITRMSGKQTSRMDVMMAFGQKSYLLAQNDKEQMIGLMGWQVENLITRVDEFYLEPAVRKEVVIHALVQAVEAASKELQSEVGFVFLPPNVSPDIVTAFGEHGYTQTTVKEIKIPAWREALQEANAAALTIIHKPLRKDRVLTPI
jgi:dephospho-CoA kinase